MSAPDVLAVIDARIAALGKPENEHPNSPRAATRAELRQVRDAVVELAEAGAFALSTQRSVGFLTAGAIRRLEAALARVQGS